MTLQSPNMFQWQVQADGSYNMRCGTLVLYKCYPAIDSVPIRPLTVTVREDCGRWFIRYQLAEGELLLALGRDGEQLTIDATLCGMPTAPHWVLPLAGGHVEGANRFFCQGMGMGGPTLFVPFPITKRAMSFMTAALLAEDDTTLTVSARDYASYHLRTTISPAGENHAALFETGFGTERIPLQGDLALPTIYLAAGTTPWDALRHTARAIANATHARTHQETCYHWCSWYYAYQNFDQPQLTEYLEGVKQLDPPVPLQTIQIDAGYFPSVGDWLDTNWRFPAGMHVAIKQIADAGYQPGIWIGPFMVGNRSRLYREHPEWILCDLNGNPVTEWRYYGEYRVWGYQDEETYVLDTSHPEAFAYLRHVFRTMRAWGCTFFKTDFMYWGQQDSTTVRRYTPGKTSVQYMREVLEMIRAEIGEESFWLGCISPYAPFLGLADAMRIAGDVTVHWGKDLPNVIQQSIGDQYMNNIFWQNDPDVVMMRDYHICMTPQEEKAMSQWQAFMGGVVNTSDPLHLISAECLNLWRFMQPTTEHNTAHLPYWGTEFPLCVAVREFTKFGAWAVLVMNPTEQTVMKRLPMEKLTAEVELYTFAWEPGTAIALGKQAALLPELPSHHAQLYFVSKTDTPPPANLTMNGACAALVTAQPS